MPKPSLLKRLERWRKQEWRTFLSCSWPVKLFRLSILAAAAWALWTSWYELPRRKVTASQQDRELGRLRHEVVALQAGKNHLEAIYGPFGDIAGAKYPRLELSAAIAQLGRDTNRAELLARRDVFRPIDREVRARITENLLALGSKRQNSAVRVIIRAQSGDRNRDLVADELAQIFHAARWNAELGPSFAFVSERDSPGVELLCHPDDVGLAEELAHALKPILMRRFSGEKSPYVEQGTVHLRLNGAPQFLPNGSIDFQ